MINKLNQVGLFSAICIGVGSIIGSGWLFASYYAAKFAGPIAIISWIIGAFISLIIALLLAEVATMFPENGLFSRLLTISHNRDIGFIVAISNWLAIVMVIPSEAVATVQYLGNIFPHIAKILFVDDGLTILGSISAICIIFIYALLNYWGIRSLTRSNNFITSIKIFIPILTGLMIMKTSFHTDNFTSYKSTIAPYGIDKTFSAIVTCGIFYAFCGFNMITVFAKELKQPQKNIPIALCSSIIICLVIYLLLQISFIGGVGPTDVAKGWGNLHYTSPFAELSILLGINWLSVVLYADAALSPSGTGIIYLGSGARMINAMAEDKQIFKWFAPVHPQYNISRVSLLFTLFCCCVAVLFFANWQKIIIVATVFRLISCIAVPIAFYKLRITKPDHDRKFIAPAGKFLSLVCFVLLSYLFLSASARTILFAILVIAAFLGIYCITFYGLSISKIFRAIKSAWTLFAYLITILVLNYFKEQQVITNGYVEIALLGSISLIYYQLFRYQKCYSPEN